jgi:hypothetical protein
MACALTSGRELSCRKSVGGIKAVYFADYGTLGDKSAWTFDSTTGYIETFGTSTPNWFQFDLKGTNSLEQAITASRENGSVVYEQTLTLTLPQLDKDTQDEIKLLAFGRPHVIVEDYNGNYLLVGEDNGADVSGGTITSGTALADLSGFTLTFLGQEKNPASFVEYTAFSSDISTTQIDPAP